MQCSDQELSKSKRAPKSHQWFKSYGHFTQVHSWSPVTTLKWVTLWYGIGGVGCCCASLLSPGQYCNIRKLIAAPWLVSSPKIPETWLVSSLQIKATFHKTVINTKTTRIYSLLLWLPAPKGSNNHRYWLVRPIKIVRFPKESVVNVFSCSYQNTLSSFDIEYCQNLSFQVLSEFEFSSFVTFWVFEFCHSFIYEFYHNFSLWVFLC